MDCKTKEMSSYQRLKWELEELYKDYKEEKTKAETFEHALWTIANLKGPEIVKAHNIAIEALFETNEKK